MSPTSCPHYTNQQQQKRPAVRPGCRWADPLKDPTEPNKAAQYTCAWARCRLHCSIPLWKELNLTAVIFIFRKETGTIISTEFIRSHCIRMWTLTLCSPTAKTIRDRNKLSALWLEDIKVDNEKDT